MEIKTKAENMLSNKNATGSLYDPIIDVNINLTEDAGAFEVRFFDLQDNLNFNGRTGRIDHTTNATDSKGYYGKTHLPGNSQFNVVEVALSTSYTTTSNGKILRNEQKIRTTDEIARTLSHELGHTAGLQHPFSPLRKEKDVSNTPALFPFPSQEATKDV